MSNNEKPKVVFEPEAKKFVEENPEARSFVNNVTDAITKVIEEMGGTMADPEYFQRRVEELTGAQVTALQKVETQDGANRTIH